MSDADWNIPSDRPSDHYRPIPPDTDASFIEFMEWLNSQYGTDHFSQYGPLTEAEWRQMQWDIFQAKQDGAVAEAQARAALEARLAPYGRNASGKAISEDWFGSLNNKGYDADGDGRISPDEFFKFRQENPHDDLNKTFDALGQMVDSGNLSQEVADAYNRDDVIGAALREQIALLDPDGSGNFSAEEWATNFGGLPNGNPDWDPTGIFHDPNNPVNDNPAQWLDDALAAIQDWLDPANAPQIGAKINPAGVSWGLFNIPGLKENGPKWRINPETGELQSPNWGLGSPTDGTGGGWGGLGAAVHAVAGLLEGNDSTDGDDLGGLDDDIDTDDDVDITDDIDDDIGDIDDVPNDDTTGGLYDGDDPIYDSPQPDDGDEDTPGGIDLPDPTDGSSGGFDWGGFFGGIFGSEMFKQAINIGASDYAYDQYRGGIQDQMAFQQGIYDDNVNRLNPYNRLGKDNISGLQSEGRQNPNHRNLFNNLKTMSPATDARYNPFLREVAPGGRSFQNPQAGTVDPSGVAPGSLDVFAPNVRNVNTTAAPGNRLFEGPQAREIDPTLTPGSRAVTGPTVGGLDSSIAGGDRFTKGPDVKRTNVNQFNPFNSDDPALRYLMDQGTKAITDQQVGRGKYHSGETLERLQDLGQGAAMNRAADVQQIMSARDQLGMAADQQGFGQQLNRNAFLDQQNRADFGENAQRFNAALAGGNQQFGQELSAAQFDNQLNQQDLSNQIAQFTASMGADAQRYGQEQGTAGFLNQLNQQDLANDLSQIGVNLQANDQRFGQETGRGQFRNQLNQQDLANSLAQFGANMQSDQQRFGQQAGVAQWLNSLNQQDLGNDITRNDQSMKQDLAKAEFEKARDAQDFQNTLAFNQQKYGQGFDYNTQQLYDDQQAFNQLLALVQGVGQPSAAGQASLGASYANNAMQPMGNAASAAGINAMNQGNMLGTILSGLFQPQQGQAKSAAQLGQLPIFNTVI